MEDDLIQVYDRRMRKFNLTVIVAASPQLPDNVGDMEPLFLAVICGCRAGIFRDALHEV
jgi:hypothetical protein